MQTLEKNRHNFETVGIWKQSTGQFDVLTEKHNLQKLERRLQIARCCKCSWEIICIEYTIVLYYIVNCEYTDIVNVEQHILQRSNDHFNGCFLRLKPGFSINAAIYLKKDTVSLSLKLSSLITETLWAVVSFLSYPSGALCFFLCVTHFSCLHVKCMDCSEK